MMGCWPRASPRANGRGSCQAFWWRSIPRFLRRRGAMPTTAKEGSLARGGPRPAAFRRLCGWCACAPGSHLLRLMNMPPAFLPKSKQSAPGGSTPGTSSTAPMDYGDDQPLALRPRRLLGFSGRLRIRLRDWVQRACLVTGAIDLFGGGSRIRTLGPPPDTHAFETALFASAALPVPLELSTCFARGTAGSNPASSTGESVFRARLPTARVQHRNRTSPPAQ